MPTIDQRCLALVALGEIEAVQTRTLQALCELTDAQSAALWVSSDRAALRLRAFRGLLERRALPEEVSAGLVQM